jgi:hypothetical protein
VTFLISFSIGKRRPFAKMLSLRSVGHEILAVKGSVHNARLREREKLPIDKSLEVRYTDGGVEKTLCMVTVAQWQSSGLWLQRLWVRAPSVTLSLKKGK